MRRIPPLAAVRAFEAAARCGTFTAAAVELGMTQAAVSYQIKVLEDRLGRSVFKRIGRRVELTQAGANLAARLSVTFDEMSGAFDEFSGAENAILRVTTTPSFDSMWLAKNLGSFQERCPGIEVLVDANTRMASLADGEYDVAVRVGSGSWEGVNAERLFATDFTPMCSPKLVEGRMTPLPPAQAADMPWISPHDRWWRVWLEEAGAEVDESQIQSAGRFQSQVSEGQAAMAGRGLAILTPALWRTELEEGRLIQPFDLVASEGDAYWVVSSFERRRSKKVEAFTKWILELLGPPGR